MPFGRVRIRSSERESFYAGVGHGLLRPIGKRQTQMRLQDKVAIVTGAATGIGQAIAVRFAREGAAVVIDYIGKPDLAGKTQEQIASFGGKSIAVAADVSKPDQVQNLIEGAVKAFGKLDIVVNNAGVEKKLAFVDYPLGELQKILDVNLIGPFLVSQAAARQMIPAGKRRAFDQHFFRA